MTAPPAEPPPEPAHEHPVELLQALVRFDTTNPPGNEEACIDYVDDLLSAAGIDTERYARDPARPNLVARLPGGDAPPLLLYGHVDVVPTEGQDWTHPPFDGAIEDGYLWGRGALDMKGGVAMLVSAFLRAKAEGLDPAGDLVLAVLSDEEKGGRYGAKFLVEEHPEPFADARYAIGEFGGFGFEVGGRRFYPVQVAEKQSTTVEVTLTGPGGHGSLPSEGDAMAALGDVLQRLDGARLPVHVTPPARAMIDGIADELSFPRSAVVRALLRPRLTDRVLDLLGEEGQMFDAVLHNTVNATVVEGGEKRNVVPGEMTLTLDGRILPGYGPEDLVAELRDLLGDGPGIEVVRHDPGPDGADVGYFETLADVLRDADPEGVPVPLLLSGSSDARFFSELGVQTYGFLPMDLPAGFDFVETIHAADERVPTDAVEFGTDAVYEAVRRYEG